MTGQWHPADRTAWWSTANGAAIGQPADNNGTSVRGSADDYSGLINRHRGEAREVRTPRPTAARSSSTPTGAATASSDGSSTSDR